MTNRLIKFEGGDAVYAMASDPNLDFSEIVGIDIGSGQTVSLGEIVLPVDVALGRTEIAIGKDRYRLVINSVRVKLDKTNANYIPGTRYGSRPPVITGGKKTELSENKGRKSSAIFNGLVGLDRINAKASSAVESSTENAMATAKTSHIQFTLAQTEGADSVRIELPEGDRGGLAGTVLSSVNESGDLTPYCRLQAIDQSTAVTGRIRVQARTTAIELQKISRKGKPVRIMDRGMRSGQLAMQQQQVDADNILKQKVASLALVMPLLSSDSGQHIDLATRGFCFYPHEEQN